MSAKNKAAPPRHKAESGEGEERASLGEYKTLLPRFYAYRFHYLAGFAFLLAVDAAQVVIPQLIRRAIDLVSGGAAAWQDVLKLTLAMIAVMAVISTGRFLWRYFIQGSSRKIEAELRQSFFDHLLTLSADFYQNNKIGDLMARATNDIGAVRNAIGWGLVALVDGTIMAAAILIIMLVQNTRLTLYAVIPLPIITAGVALAGKLLGKRFFRAQAAYSALSDIVQETFAGIRVIKSFVKEQYFVGKFAAANDTYRSANMDIVKVFGFLFPLVTFLSGFTSLIVLFAGGRQVALGRMSAGSLVALFSYLQMLIWPMLGAGFTINMIQRGAVSLSRVNKVMQSVPGIRSAANPVTPSAPAEKIIEFRSLSFAYPGGKPVLRSLSLSLERGQWLGILGRTGTGKSTLVKTLPRMIDPPPGAVFVEGVDVREWDLEALRRKFGFVSQDCYLFSDTIAANIGYGKESAAPAEVEHAAELAALSRDLPSFAEGFQTLIGERGLSLSGGQKQRTAIARALLVDPEILVLDDALSAVDAETERRLLENLHSARAGKTTIIIAHRVSAFRGAAKVAVLDSPDPSARTTSLAEYGSPAALLEQNGFYARTARLQSLDAAPPSPAAA